MNPAIALEDIHFDYDGLSVLSDFNLSVESGEILGLVGPSGSGKSTALRLILGLAAPVRGVVRLGGAVVSEPGRLVVPPEERGLAVVFQDLALWQHLTVHGNLGFGLRARGISGSEQASRIAAILGQLGLADKTRCYPGELSGGERQRVAIARALVLEPRAVLLDEPLSDLDATLKREMLGLFRGLFREHHTTAVCVTHDLREAATLGDRIAVMEAGHIVQFGSFDELKERPASEFVRDLLESLHWNGPPRE